MFGTQGQQQQLGMGGGLFGQQQQQQPATGLFGQQQQQQPATTGLFGQQQQQPATGLFGQQQQQPAGGGLFGQQQQQPATTGLFGQQQQQQPAGGGLFGQQHQQQPATTGLFGQQQPAGGGLFGQQQQQPATGLFGQQQQQQPGTTGLFGQQQQQQPASTGWMGMGNSNIGMFGQGQQQQPHMKQQQQQATTNIAIPVHLTGKTTFESLSDQHKQFLFDLEIMLHGHKEDNQQLKEMPPFLSQIEESNTGPLDTSRTGSGGGKRIENTCRTIYHKVASLRNTLTWETEHLQTFLEDVRQLLKDTDSVRRQFTSTKSEERHYVAAELHLPSKFFFDKLRQFLQRMDDISTLVRDIQAHLKWKEEHKNQPANLNVLSGTLRSQFDALNALASQVAATHQHVETFKEDYRAFRMKYLNDSTDIFEASSSASSFFEILAAGDEKLSVEKEGERLRLLVEDPDLKTQYDDYLRKQEMNQEKQLRHTLNMMPLPTTTTTNLTQGGIGAGINTGGGGYSGGFGGVGGIPQKQSLSQFPSFQAGFNSQQQQTQQQPPSSGFNFGIKPSQTGSQQQSSLFGGIGGNTTKSSGGGGVGNVGGGFQFNANTSKQPQQQVNQNHIPPPLHI